MYGNYETGNTNDYQSRQVFTIAGVYNGYSFVRNFLFVSVYISIFNFIQIISFFIELV